MRRFLSGFLSMHPLSSTVTAEPAETAETAPIHNSANLAARVGDHKTTRWPDQGTMGFFVRFEPSRLTVDR